MYLNEESIALPEQEGVDSEQFELLYSNWSLMLQKYAIYFLKDQAAAETIVNDVFVKLWLSGNAISYPKTYLYRSVKNACLNYLAQQQQQVVSYLAQDELQNISDLNVYHHQVPEESERLKFLEKLIDQLPPKRQLVFKLYRLEGLSYAEIAELLNISIRTVEDHLSKSMQFIYANAKHLLHQNLTES